MHLKRKTIHRFFPSHCLKSLVVFKYSSSPNIAWLLILFLILLFNSWAFNPQDKPFPFQNTISATNQWPLHSMHRIHGGYGHRLGNPHINGSAAIPATPSSYQYFVLSHFHITVRRGAGDIFSNREAWKFPQQPETAAINCSTVSYTCVNTLALTD